jgi:hypothetical protein
MSLLTRITNLNRNFVRDSKTNAHTAVAGDVNPIIDWINERSDTTIASNTVTLSSNAGTLNKTSGVITTESLTTGGDTSVTFTITNNTVTPSSMILTVLSYSGAGVPVLKSVNPGNGSFTIVVRNVAPSTALNGAITIKFIVL